MAAFEQVVQSQVHDRWLLHLVFCNTKTDSSASATQKKASAMAEGRLGLGAGLDWAAGVRGTELGVAGFAGTRVAGVRRETGFAGAQDGWLQLHLQPVTTQKTPL